jgi:transcriptional regulator of PTS gene
LVRTVRHLIKSHPSIFFEGIGISLPGRVDFQSQKLAFAPNLKWRNLDLKTPLERATGLPVELENAANACALAEIWSGRHPDSLRDLVAVTVSEGIGVGMILNGQLLSGRSGMAGEFGHITMNENGPLCNCGNRGCWETYASNAAALSFYTQSLPPNSRGGHASSKITFVEMLARVKRGDIKAGRALDRMAHYLGAGLAMLINGLSPDVIVVIGEVTEAWDRVGPIIQEELKRRCGKLAIPRIVPSDPATEPRSRGAVALVVQKHFGDPQAI